MRKPLLLAALSLAALALIALLRFGGDASPQATGVSALEDRSAQAAIATGPSVAAAAAVALGPEDAAFLQGLREKFGPGLRNRHGQLRAIEQIMAYLQQRYPADWRERMQAFLQALTPELAAQLATQFEALSRYQDWLRDNRERLEHLPAAQRRAELWQLRRERFGAEAAEEIWKAERRGEQMQEALAELDAVDGRRVEEKLGSYLAAIESAYGSKAAGLIERRRTELMNRFLDLKSVQTQLAAMPPEQRSSALRDIRAGMGMDAEAQDRWATLDQERDRRWDGGAHYQQERVRILADYRGEEQAQKLRDLQQRSFGEEAEVIRSEEAAGFYRHAQARRIGRE